MKLITRVSTPEGHPRSFYTHRISWDRLCRCLAKCPGVEFTKRPRILWSHTDVRAEFRFKDRAFKVEEVWADTHVVPKDDVSAYPEIVELADYVEQHGHSALGRLINKALEKIRK